MLGGDRNPARLVGAKTPIISAWTDIENAQQEILRVNSRLTVDAATQRMSLPSADAAREFKENLRKAGLPE